ncbi:MAG: Na+/H+ antiporter NhaC family protein, partial [Myxococcota bacterium]
MIWLAVAYALACPPPAELVGFDIAPTRGYQVGEVAIDLTITAVDDDGAPVAGFCGSVEVTGLSRAADGQPVTELSLVGGTATASGVLPSADEVTVSGAGLTASWQPDELRALPGWLSIVPPLLAVLLAIILRQALIALFAGVWIGAALVHGYDPLTGLFRCFDTYLPATVSSSGNASLILFTMALGGMVGVIAKSGGTQALVDAIAARAQSRRSGLVTSWAAGLVVFFDDYANCLLVGNTVRPFTDKLRISREKLAYIVDSTAAPIATVALISTWVGYQIGLFEGVFGEGSGYRVFLDQLPYSFYSFFTLAFVLALAITTRDFGPMARAERRAITTGAVLGDNAQPLMDRELTEMAPANPERSNLLTAVIPVLWVVGAVAIGLYINGMGALGDAEDPSLREIIGSADPYPVLLWASFSGGIVAVIVAMAYRTIDLNGALDAWVSGVKSMVMAVLILVLAWSLGTMCKEHLQTGPWLLSQIQPSVHWLPVITFTLSALIALATGTSYGTMAIVIPIAAPMAVALTGDGSGIAADHAAAIISATLAAVLSGAVYGDHCSPISDTTIISSMSSACDHIDHVRTQAP